MTTSGLHKHGHTHEKYTGTPAYSPSLLSVAEINHSGQKKLMARKEILLLLLGHSLSLRKGREGTQA